MPELKFLGHACFMLKDGNNALIIDPFLTGNPQSAAKADQIDCQYILVSHGHDDHLGDTVSIAKRTGATVISTAEIARFCAPPPSLAVDASVLSAAIAFSIAALTSASPICCGR